MAELREEIEQAVAGVLDDGRFVLGPTVEAFEAAFATWCRVRHAVGVASGTDAIAIALQAVGVGAGDEVLTTSNSGVPTVAGIEASGARPVLVEVDEATYTLDPARLEQALTGQTRAIVPVHLYGQCADMDPILAFAAAHGLKVVEDAAQAHGAEYRGRRAGTLGDAAAFSFYPTKNLGAFGDGGAVVTDDAEVAAAARVIRSYGERERYDSLRRGTNSRLDAIQAAILLAKLRRLDAWNERRCTLAAEYSASLQDTGLVLPLEAEGRRHAYHLFVVRSPRRDELRAALHAAGIGTLVHYPRPVHLQPGYADLARPDDGMALSERLCREVLSLPLYPELTDEEAEAVVSAVRTAVLS